MSAEQRDPHRVTNVGVDWVTATATSRGARSQLWALGDRILNRREHEGEHPSTWHANGYRGFHAPGVALGERADSVMLRLSSLEAAKEWREAAATGENLSRLDLAVDVEADPPMPLYGVQVYEDSGHVSPRNGRRPGRSRYCDSYGGNTTYIGSRTSESFGRLYDKGVETKTRLAGHWWRFEVEYKGERAWALGRRLAAARAPENAMLRLVAGWFRERTAHAPPCTSSAPKYFVDRKPTTDEQRLRWLAASVRPTVSILIERLGRERVLTALGIPPEERSERPRPTHTLQRVS